MDSPVRGNVRLSLTDLPEEDECYRCFDCNVNFTSEHYLLRHLLHHIRQPSVLIRRLQQAPIKLTFKSRSDNNFEIINSPTSVTNYMFTSEYLTEESQVSTGTDNSEVGTEDSGTFSTTENLDEHNDILDEMLEQSQLEDPSKNPFSSDFIMVENELTHNEEDNQEMNVSSPATITDLNGSSTNLQQGERETPPSQSSSPGDYPKIRIKTTGLLKERLTITEITDDNPTGEYRGPDMVELPSNNDTTTNNNFWSSCLEDPLKLPDQNRDDSSLLSNFLSNNNDQAKAFGITTDSEFISLDRLDDRNRNALQVYNPTSSVSRDNALESLTGLPMQQLTEQVSRLQPSGGTGMHQQNVLINIQQFPQAPPQTSQHYQPMYPPHPPHPGIPSQPPPLYQPYQYQPTPMYYPPTPNYRPNHPHMPPPLPQMQQPNQQMPQQAIAPHQPQPAMPPPQPPQYRQPMPPRPPVPRQFNPQQQRGPPPRAPMAPRQRAPMMRPRGGGVMGTAVRGPRPRMPVNQGQMNGNLQNQQNQHRVVKRTPDQMQNIQMKKKRMDVLVPDKNDDADCQVIAVQPKNTDGGLPQIQSVQGGTTDPGENVMHLSDSITLSVRNPPPKPPSPKRSDAKDVANILATRGITVTASAKPKEKASKDGQTPVAINLNSAVSIIPTARNSTSPTPKSPGTDAKLPTVDLTDDSAPEPARIVAPKPLPAPPPQKNVRNTTLPFKCDLCPAQYPTLGGLSKHRQTYHKTGSPCEIGIPLIDLKQPGVLQKLSNLGITNFIPMPSSTPDGHFALPIVTLNAARNSSICNLNALGASSILSLGPVRSLTKAQVNNNAPSTH